VKEREREKERGWRDKERRGRGEERRGILHISKVLSLYVILDLPL